jgi:APA family basic amino acid/polyamine antiporter
MLAMGHRRDMPTPLARLDARVSTPWAAVLVTDILIADLTLAGSVKTTWAFIVLIYYAITNACALALPLHPRLFPRWIPVTGLVSCLGLALRADQVIWLSGLGLGLAGLFWWAIAQSFRGSKTCGGTK